MSTLYRGEFRFLRTNPIYQAALEFTRPANTTPYTAGDAVAPVTKAITAASNATPVVITSAAHGLVTDDRVTIAAVGGNTNANGDWNVVKIDANTFSLKTEAGVLAAGNAAYTSGGTFQKVLRVASVVEVNGGMASLLSVRLITDIATVTNGTFRLRGFTQPIAQIADNAAFTLLYANRAKRVFDVALPIIVTEGAGSDASEVSVINAQPITFSCDPSRTDLFLQLTAIGAFTPGSGENFRLEMVFRRESALSPT